MSTTETQPQDPPARLRQFDQAQRLRQPDGEAQSERNEGKDRQALPIYVTIDGQHGAADYRKSARVADRSKYPVVPLTGIGTGGYPGRSYRSH